MILICEPASAEELEFPFTQVQITKVMFKENRVGSLSCARVQGGGVFATSLDPWSRITVQCSRLKEKKKSEIGMIWLQLMNGGKWEMNGGKWRWGKKRMRADCSRWKRAEHCRLSGEFSACKELEIANFNVDFFWLQWEHFLRVPVIN